MARCLARGSDCTNGSPNLHRAIPARRTPSGPSGHLPRSAEKGGGAGVAESFRTLQLSFRMLPKRCNFLPKIAIPCPDLGLIKGLRASWRKKIMMASFVAVQKANSPMGFPLSAQASALRRAIAPEGGERFDGIDHEGRTRCKGENKNRTQFGVWQVFVDRPRHAKLGTRCPARLGRAPLPQRRFRRPVPARRPSLPADPTRLASRARVFS